MGQIWVIGPRSMSYVDVIGFKVVMDEVGVRWNYRH